MKCFLTSFPTPYLSLIHLYLLPYIPPCLLPLSQTSPTPALHLQLSLILPLKCHSLVPFLPLPYPLRTSSLHLSYPTLSPPLTLPSPTLPYPYHTPPPPLPLPTPLLPTPTLYTPPLLKPLPSSPPSSPSTSLSSFYPLPTPPVPLPLWDLLFSNCNCTVIVIFHLQKKCFFEHARA